MKFNWGHGIAIFLIVFVISTVGVVVYISTNSEFDHEVVSDFYYKEGLEYQLEIERENNLNKLESKFSYSYNTDGLSLYFPKELDASKITGRVELYRPSKKILDFKQDVKLDDNNKMLIPADKLLRGKWRMKVFFEDDKQEYLYKEELNL